MKYKLYVYEGKNYEVWVVVGRKPVGYMLWHKGELVHVYPDNVTKYVARAERQKPPRVWIRFMRAYAMWILRCKSLMLIKARQDAKKVLE